jgi:taurine dioxygenase
MLSIEQSGKIMGTTIRGVDLSKPVSDRDFGKILATFGQYTVVRFPNQPLTPAQHIAFTERFGEIHALPDYSEPGHPGVNILSNIVENGRNIGNVDAGMIWHKDMTYVPVAGFATILHALKIPHRDGRPLGGTQFINVQAATDDLPADVTQKLNGAIGLHSVAKYNAVVRAAGSKRANYTDIPDDRKRPIRAHPMLLAHPVTGKTVLYCDPSHVERIEGLDDADSEHLLQFLADHQLQAKYQYIFDWSEGDVLMWDNFGALHRATLDYGPDEPRLLKRCQAMSEKVRDPAFVKAALEAASTDLVRARIKSARQTIPG